MVQYEQANQDVFTLKQMEMFYDYFKQQEKKDELLELYKEYFQIVERGDNDWHYRMNEIPEQIKALEEELK